MNKSSDLTSGSLFGTIVGMSLPIVAGSFLQTGYNLIDTLFVSRIGDVEVGAVTFIFPIALTILAMAYGLSTAGISLISQSTGAGDKAKVNHYAVHILILGLSLAILIGISGYFWGGRILAGLKLSGALLEAGGAYIGFIFLATPFTFFNVIYGSIRNSEGRARKALMLQVISLLLNILFNYLFIFRFSMGIRGAALATLSARGVAAAYGAYDLLYARSGFRIDFSRVDFSWKTTGLIFRLGIPAALGKGSTSLGFVIMNIVIVGFGSDVLAAFGIGSRINSLFFMPSTGFGMALSAIVGQNIGAGQTERARDAVKMTVGITLVFSVLAALILYRFSPGLARLFSTDPEVIRHAMNYMRLVAITVIPWGVFQAMTGVFQGAGFTRSAMLVSLIRLWILRIPILIILNRFTGLAEYSIWYSMLISNTITAFASVVLYFIVPWTRGVEDLRREP